MKVQVTHHHRRRPVALVAACLLAVIAVPPAAAQLPPGGLPARVVVYSPEVEAVSYPSVDYGRRADSKDDRRAVTTWRMVHRTGNCCENYLTVTPDGRLLDFGGTYVNFTDDEGLTWRQVQPLTPLQNGEGAIVAGLDGDVIAVGWDPYTGDHLQSFKYDASTAQWLYAEMPLHQPFYDREWISVVPGPITIDGRTHDYVSFIKGGTPWKEIWFYSTDGLTYTDVSSKAADQLLSGATTQAALPAAARPENDWVQANTNGGMTQLGGGDLLARGDLLVGWSLFEGEAFGWSEYAFPDGSDPAGLFQVDSLGRVHNVVPSSDGTSFVYRISTDGGSTWQSTTVSLPPSHSIEELDFRANRAAGVGAVAIHAQNLASQTDQDLAYKLDITTAAPRLQRAYVVGLGDQNSTAGVTNDVRMDFQTLAILPDGRLAMSVLDSTTNLRPALVIEQATTLGSKIGRVAGDGGGTVTPVLGEPYAGYSFDAGDDGWTTAGTGLWLRQQPGTAGGPDDPDGYGWAFWDAQYANLLNASVVSPPITTEAGLSVIEFWMKLDTEPGFDYLFVEWSAGGGPWQSIAQYAGRGDAYPDWQKVTVGFDSPGGNVQVRFRLQSDELCSWVEQVFCSGEHHGVRIDEVTVGRQAAT